MHGLKKRRRIQVIVLALICLVGATGLIGFALRDGINLFRSPTQVFEFPPLPSEVFRVGGLVVADSVRVGGGVQFFFDITDGANTVPIKYIGNDLPPDLFEEGQGTIATGTFSDGLFLATEILAKHDESYMPKEVIDALKKQGVYKDPSGAKDLSEQ